MSVIPFFFFLLSKKRVLSELFSRQSLVAVSPSSHSLHHPPKQCMCKADKKSSRNRLRQLHRTCIACACVVYMSHTLRARMRSIRVVRAGVRACVRVELCHRCCCSSLHSHRRIDQSIGLTRRRALGSIDRKADGRSVVRSVGRLVGRSVGRQGSDGI